MKKVMCFLLCVVLILGVTPVCFAAEAPEIKVATADVFSTEYIYDTCKVYLNNDKWFIQCIRTTVASDNPFSFSRLHSL